jgi:hypothetical protein
MRPSTSSTSFSTLTSSSFFSVPGRYYVPYADIYETDEALSVVMEMPGVGWRLKSLLRAGRSRSHPPSRPLLCLLRLPLSFLAIEPFVPFPRPSHRLTDVHCRDEVAQCVGAARPLEGRHDVATRVRRSKVCGLLFHRLAEQAVAIDPPPYSTITGKSMVPRASVSQG